MKRVFDRAAAGQEAARQLADLRQEDLSVADYSIKFRSGIDSCMGWPTVFTRRSTSSSCQPVSTGSSTWRSAWTLGLTAWGRRPVTRLLSIPESGNSSRENMVGPVIDHKPMQVGRARLSREEREAEVPRTMSLLRWLGTSPTHVSGKRASPVVSLRLLSCGISAGKSSTTSSTLLPVKLRWGNNTHTCHALLDSGAEDNFIDTDLAHDLNLPVLPLSRQIHVSALNGQELPPVTHTTEPITLLTSGNHNETLPLLLMNSPVAPMVLGHPWLVKHNPRVDWGSNTVTLWSESCHESCLVSACPAVSVLQEETMVLSNVPAEYLDLKEVFSKSRAASLPPHRPYDCAIDLVPGRSPPKGKLYSLSIPERRNIFLILWHRGSSALPLLQRGRDSFLWGRRMVLCDLVLITES
uniref:Retrotransposon gag domain-containing protein n=1 Tax=Cyprinus carpio TaxID=7962 RepID=A0A8C1X667_CYPCA